MNAVGPTSYAVLVPGGTILRPPTGSAWLVATMVVMAMTARVRT
jgi:hypothetical protein